MTSGPTYEMFWDCSRCGTKELLGKTHRQCPNCGAPQDASKRYFPPPVKEIAVENLVYYGVDRICEACKTPNSARAHFCRNCAAPLDEAARAQLITEGTAQLPPAAASSSLAALDTAPEAAAPLEPGCKIVIAGVVIVVAFILVAIFGKREATAEITKHRWQRVVAIEDFDARKEEAWCDEMPADARAVSRHNEQRSTRQVPDGEECTTRRVDNGDGTFSEHEECRTKYREEPVYDSRCFFTVDRWAKKRELTAQGTGTQPAWPEVVLVRAGNCLGCEREGGRIATYTLDMKRADREFECGVSEDVWRAHNDGSKVRLKVRAMDGAPDCSTLR
jgi:hypothetical protein